jgi:FkbM family methyltransferase
MNVVDDIYKIVKLFKCNLPLKTKLKFLLTTKKLKGGNKEVVRSLYKEIFWNNDYLPNFKPNLIIDAGANIGMSTEYFRTLYPKTLILSFEPSTFHFNMLKHNVYKKIYPLGSVTLYELALGSKKKLINFYISKLKTSLSNGRRDKNNTKKIVVKQDLLSSFIYIYNTFVKIDIEGYETDVIKDLDKNKSFKYIKGMVIEYHNNLDNNKNNNLDEILYILRKNKFVCTIESGLQIGRYNNFQDIIIKAEKYD